MHVWQMDTTLLVLLKGKGLFAIPVLPPLWDILSTSCLQNRKSFICASTKIVTLRLHQKFSQTGISIRKLLSHPVNYSSKCKTKNDINRAVHSEELTQACLEAEDGLREEEKQRILMQMQWKVIDSMPQEDREVTSKKVYSISSSRKKDSVGKNICQSILGRPDNDRKVTDQLAKTSHFFRATQTPVLNMLKTVEKLDGGGVLTFPKPRKVTYHEYEVDATTGNTIKRQKTMSTVMFSGPTKHERTSTPRARGATTPRARGMNTPSARASKDTAKWKVMDSMSQEDQEVTSKKVTHHEYEVDTTAGNTIKRRKTKSIVMFSDPKKQKGMNTPRARVSQDKVTKGEVQSCPSNIVDLFCEGSLNPYVDDLMHLIKGSLVHDASSGSHNFQNLVPGFLHVFGDDVNCF